MKGWPCRSSLLPAVPPKDSSQMLADVLPQPAVLPKVLLWLPTVGGARVSFRFRRNVKMRYRFYRCRHPMPLPPRVREREGGGGAR